MKRILFVAMASLIVLSSFVVRLLALEETKKTTYPKVMVVTNEYIDGIAQAKHEASVELEKIFKVNHFPVVVRENAKKVNLDDIALTFRRPEAIALIGKSSGADVVVAGYAKSDLAETSLPYGDKVYTYNGRFQGRAVRVRDGKVIAMDVVLDVARDTKKEAAARDALKKVGSKLSRSLMTKIKNAWAEKVYEPTTIRLVCKNADLQTAMVLKKSLNMMRYVTGIKEKALIEGALEIDVIYLGTRDQLVLSLRQRPEPLMEVASGVRPDRINIKFLRQAWQ